MNYFKGQTKRFDTNRNERGITLVALIITIIILIILAAVTINALTHDGLADLAVKASQDYQREQTNEMEKLNEIDNMVKETLKNIEDGTVIPPAPDAPGVESVTLTVDGTPNGSIAKVIATVQPENAGVVSYKFEYKLSTEADYKLGQEINSSNKSCSYTYMDLTQLVVNNLKVTVTDHKGNNKEAIIEVTPDVAEPMNPTIDTTYGGLEVAYIPKAGQTYNVASTYSGYSSNQSWSTSDYTGTWSVWGTDDNYIYIISTTGTSKTLYLQGALGYNNGVTLLDTLCDTIFTDKTTYPGSAAQNLKLEQVLAVKASSISNNYASTYGTQPYTYEYTYPYTWNAYEKTEANSTTNRSTAYPLTTNTTTTSQTYSPYFTLWHNTTMKTSTAWINSNYYTLVLLTGEPQSYWLSSRFVQPSTSWVCNFGMHYIMGGGVYEHALYWRDHFGTDCQSYTPLAIRPIVSFPRSMYELDTSTTPAKIVKK